MFPGHEQRLDMFDERFGLLGGSRVAIAFLAQWLNRHDVLPACSALCGTVHAMQGETPPQVNVLASGTATSAIRVVIGG